MSNTLSRILAVVGISLLISCFDGSHKNHGMVRLLSEVAGKAYSPDNAFCVEARMKFFDSLLTRARTSDDSAFASYYKANTWLEMGNEQESVNILERLLNNRRINDMNRKQNIMKNLAMACLRMGERMNCIGQHAAESCIFPIAGRGIHQDKRGAMRAIELYEALLKNDSSDLESRWLLNIAYMTAGRYPEKVPAVWLIKGLDEDTSQHIKPFTDAAVHTGLDVKNQAGGAIIDDFNNDGYLDIITSSWNLKEGMHYCINNGNGSFTDASVSSGLKYLTGGLHIMQTDYNNDGLKDVFVLRGAWKAKFGKEPNSLLRNNGNGTFTDVTKESGLLSFHPTQTATWADFNNDGWLDVFIGNETSTTYDAEPCELYMNNKNGTFTEVAAAAGCNVIAFVKGVTSGDYDKDGWPDIFISTLNGVKILLKNDGRANSGIHFTDVTVQAGLHHNLVRTFPTWFWDYDNDGWLDILVCSYEFNRSLAWYAAAEALGRDVGQSGKIFLFRNNHNGTFEEVSQKAGLNKIAFAMGSNFGDIDNDGYLDMYLGTGNPLYQSLVPNKMFRNIDGKRFADVTIAARVGNLQKGHSVAFADLDNDGDQDIYIDMGGAYAGDAYQNALYINPGQNNNHWINLSLQGAQSNRVAIGAKITVTFNDGGVVRTVYRELNSGGSFGAGPLLQHIGIGQAAIVQQIRIQWPGSKRMQVFENIPANENISIQEGNPSFTKVKLNKTDFSYWTRRGVGCAPY
jgi:hypothetical protein